MTIKKALRIQGSLFDNMLNYIRKWANALFASAIL